MNQVRPGGRGLGVSARIFLQPIAAPYVLGLYAFAGAAAMVGADTAGWFGTATTPLRLAPFVALFGGLAQFVAALWAYRARDALATAILGVWGSFWLGYGLLFLLFAGRVLPRPAGPSADLGIWFAVLAWISWVQAFAAMAFSWSLTATMVLGSLAASVRAAGEFGGSVGLGVAAGWLLVLAGVAAWYVAGALLLEASYHRPILPLGRTAPARQAPAVSPGLGEPGVRRGQ